MVTNLIFPTLWVDVLKQYITEGNRIGVSAKLKGRAIYVVTKAESR